MSQHHVEWMSDGACNGSNPEPWFTDRRDLQAEAVAICHTCPVRIRCLDYALTETIRYGVWGGLTADERRRVRRKRWKMAQRERSA